MSKFNDIQDERFRGCSRMWGAGQKDPPFPNRWKLANPMDENWYSYTLPKEDPQKYINHVTYPLSSADIGIFSAKIIKYCYIKKYRYRLQFDT